MGRRSDGTGGRDGATELTRREAGGECGRGVRAKESRVLAKGCLLSLRVHAHGVVLHWFARVRFERGRDGRCERE